MVNMKGDLFGPNASLGKVGSDSLEAGMWPHTCVLQSSKIKG